MRLKIGIVTVPRKIHYVHQTIESIKKTSGKAIPLKISVGALDSSYLDRYRGDPAISIDAMTQEEYDRVGFEKFHWRQRSSYGHVRGMEMMLRCKDEWDVALMLEDDVIFAEGWREYLEPLVVGMAGAHGNRWMLTLFQFNEGVSAAHAKGHRMTPVNWNIFNGAPAMVFGKGVLPEMVKFIHEKCIDEMLNVIDIGMGMYARDNGIPVKATVPCLVQHIGVVTSGLDDKPRKLVANLFYPSVKHLLPNPK